jgi:hypothetical protein
MRVQRIGSMMNARRLRAPAFRLGLLTGLCVLALAAWIGGRAIFAQVTPLPSTSTGQLGISPEEPVPPPQPIIIKVPAPSQQERAVQEEQAAVQAIPEPDPKNPVAVQSANLLKMAYGLKSEVDKTTKDTLSVSVVRKAAEIEQMARKMRTR